MRLCCGAAVLQVEARAWAVPVADATRAGLRRRQPPSQARRRRRDRPRLRSPRRRLLHQRWLRPVPSPKRCSRSSTPMCWKPCFCCEDGGAADRPVRHSSDGRRCDSGDVDGCADTRTGLAQYALVLPYELAAGRQRDKAGRGDECVEEEEGKSPPPEPRARSERWPRQPNRRPAAPLMPPGSALFGRRAQPARKRVKRHLFRL